MFKNFLAKQILFPFKKIEFKNLIFWRYNATSIYALASGSNQRCGVAVVRLSGKSTLDVLHKLTNKNEKACNYEPRKMYLRELWHPLSKEKIDKSLVVWFKGFKAIFS